MNEVVASLSGEERQWLTKFVQCPGPRNPWWDALEVEALAEKGRLIQPFAPKRAGGMYVLTALGLRVAKACEELRQSREALE